MSDAPAVEGTSARQKRLALVAAILSSTIVSVDSTVVNVALPAIERDLGGGLAGQQWVANAYLIALSALILIGGSLADLYGERRIFVLGVLGFGVASLLCAIAPTIEVLIGARALQGVSGALLTPSALAVIIAVFPESERGGAIGSWTAYGGIGMLIGPLLGGQIVDTSSWRLIFALNLPLVLVTLALARTAVPGRREEATGVRIDAVGGLLCALGLAGPTFALIQQPSYGWSSPGVLVPLIGGLAVFAAFIWWESRAPSPMLPLGLFARRNFAVGNLLTLFMYAGLAILGFFLTLYLQQVAGYSAFKAGLTGLVPTIVMFLFSKRIGAEADRRGPRVFLTVGPALASVGFLLMLRFDTSVSFWTDLIPAILVFSIGLSFTVSPLTAAVLSDADDRNAGIASGTNNAVARTAGLLATAAVGAVVAAQFGSTVDERLGDRALSPAGQAAVAEAKRRSFGVAESPGVLAEEQATIAQATEAASVGAFRLAAGIGAVLLGLAALSGGVGLRTERRRPVEAEHCFGGSLVGAPRDAAVGARRAVQIGAAPTSGRAAPRPAA